ncbi:SGNH/GDSL hydrolase family protein [Listeria costaricensis]|uniref:SGNH/GDSL hydrolase family protein n=1 Tax=Listeria costaricensis TaxID=2026604 RepID=UPI000C086DC4|nr:SGNH/GDSL hydrolase family protein [Listeria costaricensis]
MWKKKYWWFVIPLLCIVLLACGYYAKQYLDYRAEMAKTPIRLVAMGDSLTEGVGDEEENGGYVGILETKFKKNEDVRSVATSNYGVAGNRIDQLLKRLKTQDDFRQDVKKANVITITIGGNDVMAVLKSKLLDVQVSDFEKADQSFEKDLKELFDEIRSLNQDAEVYLVGIYNPYTTYFSQIEEFDQVISEWNAGSEKIVAEEDRAHFVPIADKLENREAKNKDKPNPLLSTKDYFHPNHKGYEVMAEAIYQSIDKDLEAGRISK